MREPFISKHIFEKTLTLIRVQHLVDARVVERRRGLFKLIFALFQLRTRKCWSLPPVSRKRIARTIKIGRTATAASRNHASKGNISFTAR